MTREYVLCGGIHTRELSPLESVIISPSDCYDGISKPGNVNLTVSCLNVFPFIKDSGIWE